MKNEETIVTIAETTCGGNIYFYNCYDIWITRDYEDKSVNKNLL